MLRGETKARALSKTRADLAIFAYRHRQGNTWEELRLLWNRQHPNMKPRKQLLFNKDCRQAFKRIAGEALPWKGRS